MSAIVVDLLLVLLIVFSVINGMRRGLFLSIAGLIIIIASFIGATAISKAMTPVAADVLEPYLSIAWDNFNKDNPEKSGASENVDIEVSDKDEDESESGGKYNADFIGKLSDMIKDNGVFPELRKFFMNSLSYAIVFLVSFMVLSIGLRFVFNQINSMIRLPVIETLNAAGGAVFGFLWGFLIAYAIAFVLSVFAVYTSPDLVQKSVMMRILLSIPLFNVLSPYIPIDIK